MYPFLRIYAYEGYQLNSSLAAVAGSEWCDHPALKAGRKLKQRMLEPRRSLGSWKYPTNVDMMGLGGLRVVEVFRKRSLGVFNDWCFGAIHGGFDAVESSWM